ncbi:60S ribosomal export protein NMD3 [Sphaerodactylus townsendi]|uniref:60S ribosomal export protein NMD3 n=1 Tax=Sphaerodactylus townsendi TaxID=933632 RepID=UPI0020262F37|nr:60S ribosomal export protein NMD3 [Sphaerodactylus townsendi]XP_048362029.1 60S ribosomal export protein NMD3 [Sphaerodactylus townsendi]XP_048362030.1 60S ribosomal export protein NMD3 [Sphaerodactylus townsendi]
MEYMKEPANVTQGNILCCQCGTAIPPNPVNMCVACLRTQVDITEGIPKQVIVHFCKQCERYLQPPGTWVQCALESRELLSLCLKKIKASLSKVRLIDAGFVWTEPHSKRLKVKLTVQKEVMNGAILQQVFVIEYVVHSQMCDDCHRVEAKDFWKAVVQIRQKTVHKKTFYYLEQLILKHKLHQNTLRIKEIHDGLDFYYASKQHAQKMVDFLQCTVPCRSKSSQRLISHDIHNNTYNYKSTFSMEIVPICKDNIVCLSPKLAQSLGNMSQICVCIRVTSTIHIIDPNTLQIAEIDGSTYWRHPFNSLFQPKQLEEFIVMDISRVHDKKQSAGAGMKSSKHTLAEAWVQKTSELSTDQQYFCRTHLGHLLNPGDLVLGFDLANCNLNDEFANKMNPQAVPDVVLIKKSYDRTKRQRRRNWKLKELERDREGMDTDDERQYQDFLEDLEEDEAIRKNVNIFKNPVIPVESDTDDEGVPRISLAEMLEDLQISQDATGGEGADMLTE